ncbi:hypothetical protein [Alkalinema sp. FACHB-956]|uniref:hypothetical protein n=1 Tax=Alkalinema sp. FACHB-956 TaxID=2692768 RepID=UPI001F558344|nr:hypothetical protein [Alkalinema sp. FACHB-956]
MASSHMSNQDKGLSDAKVWDSLKRAIADSSGFQRWRLDRSQDQRLQSVSLDFLVHLYLRETLETLAY